LWWNAFLSEHRSARSVGHQSPGTEGKPPPFAFGVQPSNKIKSFALIVMFQVSNRRLMSLSLLAGLSAGDPLLLDGISADIYFGVL
jgi:hypothetical protein